jgi:hypothetical protein
MFVIKMSGCWRGMDVRKKEKGLKWKTRHKYLDHKNKNTSSFNYPTSNTTHNKS